MKAWRAHAHGPFAEALRWEECDAPDVPSTGALIEVRAAGVGFADILAIAGTAPGRSRLPFIPGQEAAGVVVESGAESCYRPGDRVIACGTAGAFAELVAAPDAYIHGIPGGMPDDHAAGFATTYQTAYLALVHRADLRAGQTLVVHGGAGGVGSAAIQIGRCRGATVIATDRGGAKVALLEELGADHRIDNDTHDFAEEVLRLTAGAGADVIFDPVGGEIFDRSIQCVAFGGKLLAIGCVSGEPTEADAMVLMEKNIDVCGVNLRRYQCHAPELIRTTHAHLCELYQNGMIKPMIHEHLPLTALHEALAAIAEQRSLGKVVCLVGPHESSGE
jgi:NADPH2:quinone reductase